MIFSPSLSFSVTGLCQTLIATDTTNYTNNDQGYDESKVADKTFTFRDGTGAIIKTETIAANVYSSSVAISLLTLNISVSLSVRLGAGINQEYLVSNALLIPCLGV